MHSSSLSRSMEKKHRERLNALEQELLSEREVAALRCSSLSQKYEKEHFKWQESERTFKETIARLEQVSIHSYFIPSHSFGKS